MTMWALWAATECEPHTVQIIYHRIDYPETRRDETVVNAAITALRSPLRVPSETSVSPVFQARTLPCKIERNERAPA
jgi:hypothetical protein